jgi:hypothetical protein
MNASPFNADSKHNSTVLIRRRLDNLVIVFLMAKIEKIDGKAKEQKNKGTILPHSFREELTWTTVVAVTD